KDPDLDVRFCVDQDYVTAKYDAEGHQLWVKTYGYLPGGWERATQLAVDGSGNVYVTGGSQGLIAVDYATIKYAPDGTVLWVQRSNGPANASDSAQALALDASGNVYVTGISLHGSNGDYLTIKYDTEGTLLWEARRDSGNADGGFAITTDASGSVYV